MAIDDAKRGDGASVPDGGRRGGGRPEKRPAWRGRAQDGNSAGCADAGRLAEKPQDGRRTPPPATSTTLLRDMASGADHARWADFVARYRPMMESFMRRRFPDVEPEDAIQETLVALLDALPAYRYVPGETGYFHNYLTGILSHKALNMRRANRRRENRHERYRADMPAALDGAGNDSAGETRERRSAILEIALQQLMADDSILERNRLIFRRVAMDGESPDAVAGAFGVTRAVVDQTKKRLTDRLKALVEKLERIDG